MAPSFDSATFPEKKGNRRSHGVEKQTVSAENREVQGIGPVDRACHVLETAVDRQIEPVEKGVEKSGDQRMKKLESKELAVGGKTVSENMVSPVPHATRFDSDFEKIKSLGHGGFGRVVLGKNKVDGRQYAIKRIPLLDKTVKARETIMSEVKALSSLEHKNIVRYYQSWIEDEFGNLHGGAPFYSNETENDGISVGMKSLVAPVPNENEECTYLYIQMEYCPRTLRNVLDIDIVDLELRWYQFRQIVDGLQHIHHQRIVHCDLKPDNIFLDAHENIKIGDFGLAKFLESEHGHHDQHCSAEKAEFLQEGTYFYKGPEFNQKFPEINEKVDMFSLGVIFFEMCHQFSTKMERNIALSALKTLSQLPPNFLSNNPRESEVIKVLVSRDPGERPTATKLICDILPPRVERECLHAVLRSLKSSVMNANMHDGWRWNVTRNNETETEFRDRLVEFVKEVFIQHNAKRLELPPVRALDPNLLIFSRNKVNLLTGGGSMLELCDELRSSFISWIIALEILHFRRYEISWVYRSASGNSTPDRLLQGEFDIVGGSPLFSEAESIKVVMDIATNLLCPENIHIHLNDGRILEAIWSWIGIPRELRHVVAERFSLLCLACSHSIDRERNWSVIRSQLLEEFHLSEDVVYRAGTAGLSFCGSVHFDLAKLRELLSNDTITSKALEDLSTLSSFLKVMNIGDQVCLNVLMLPTKSYYSNIFFQIYHQESGLPSTLETSMMASGGRYDNAVHQLWNPECNFGPPGAVGVDILLENIRRHSRLPIRPPSLDRGSTVLICLKDGSGLLQECMALVADLWNAKIMAEFVPLGDLTLTEQYEYASEHDIKCIIIITEACLPPNRLLKVQHVKLKKEKEVKRGMIVEFLQEAFATSFKNFSISS